jgi:hypothetical protein
MFRGERQRYLLCVLPRVAGTFFQDINVPWGKTKVPIVCPAPSGGAFFQDINVPWGKTKVPIVCPAPSGGDVFPRHKCSVGKDKGTYCVSCPKWRGRFSKT